MANYFMIRRCVQTFEEIQGMGRRLLIDSVQITLQMTRASISIRKTAKNQHYQHSCNRRKYKNEWV